MTHRIVVTGGNGQLGNCFRALASSYPTFDFTFVDIEEFDLTSEASVRKYFEDRPFNFLVNCAAYTAVDKAEDEEAISGKLNAEAVRTLASLCRERNARLIHVSTDYVFSGTGNSPLKETDVTGPLSVYGRTKLQGEKIALEVAPDSYVIRTSWLYSMYGKNFVKTILHHAHQKPELKVVVDQIGTPTYAEDLAGAIMQIIASVISGKKDKPGLYHYSNEGVCSWYDFAQMIVSYSGAPCKVYPIPTSEFPTKAVRPGFTMLDKSAIKKTFDLSIPHWTESLQLCLNKLKV